MVNAKGQISGVGQEEWKLMTVFSRMMGVGGKVRSEET